MRRANDITNEELLRFCSWYVGRYGRHTPTAWLSTSIEGWAHCPHSDSKKLIRRLRELGLYRPKKENNKHVIINVMR